MKAKLTGLFKKLLRTLFRRQHKVEHASGFSLKYIKAMAK